MKLPQMFWEFAPKICNLFMFCPYGKVWFMMVECLIRDALTRTNGLRVPNGKRH